MIIGAISAALILIAIGVWVGRWWLVARRKVREERNEVWDEGGRREDGKELGDAGMLVDEEISERSDGKWSRRKWWSLSSWRSKSSVS